MRHIIRLKADIIVLIFLLASGSILQLFFLNLDYWAYKLDQNSIYNVEFTLTDMEVANWDRDGQRLTSRVDPIIVLPNVQCQIDRLRIQFRTEPEIPYLELFYINEVYPNYGEIIIHESLSGNDIIVEIGDYVQDLRIDLGDDAGITLYDLVITINPIKIQFFPATLVAIVVLYFCSKFLFYLQKSPNYDLDDLMTKRD